ncbi:class I SAM-dependent methyltransferase [bacterium]|nr:class I SAM-dependent methyltransferase [bacterium]
MTGPRRAGKHTGPEGAPAADGDREAAQSLYADPALYDILYSPGTAAEIDALQRIERALAAGPLRPDRLWFEPACGTGRCLRVAAGRGRRVAGFDREPALLAYAAGRLAGIRRSAALPRPRLFTADLADFAVPAARAGLRPGAVDFAFITVNSLRHLGSDRAMLAHFAQIADLLRPGGLYVVGLSLTDYQWLWPDEDLWTGARGRCRVSQLVNWLPPEPGTPRARRERAISHLTVTRPGGVQHLDDAYDLRCYDLRQWRRLVGRSALAAAGSFDARGRPLPPGIWPYQLEALRRE